MSDALPPGSTLGVLGGGQLGRMFAHSAQRHGYRVHCWAQDVDEPAVRASDVRSIAPFGDEAARERFAASADAVTVEFENVPAATLRKLAGFSPPRPVRPGADVLAVAQDRRREKTAAANAGFATAPWREVSTKEQATAAPTIARPAILKTARDGYDGKGQVRLGDGDDLLAAWESLGGVPCVLEGRVEFALELSAIAARWPDGTVRVHGPFENDHVNGVLDLTLFPARVDPVVTAEAIRIAAGMAEALNAVGLLTVELFLTPAGDLVVNELAPRPHNSGHVTIEACGVSQFDQQVRVTAGLPPGDPSPRSAGAMANLLGDLWPASRGETGEPDWAGMLHDFPDVALHLYGKDDAKPGRKMGHLTATAGDPEAAARRVLAARERLTASA
ncbi:5-(carboxyamino)imidazole ribonucleotide synthase [Alienimonas chondri]|uniref:N5-carboxyaminoimidazole ribonucleotide synthase n=1 Tax=Alienimonas chondri TaxID=2681879 RepID=A0ABX1VA61_9PLAN|nr:5-(carboxyamino)imidazole ribonucleotide synthase [Alienimonas chondri]NNJ24791.1 N5-carboxyaminoimidazole ribonucleotide synthase [Alienimonas chondri]